MKVCFFPHYSKTYQNGATLSLLNIANELVEKGIEVIIIQPNKNLIYPIDNEKIKCISVPAYSMRAPVNYHGLISSFKGMIKTLYNWYSMKKVLSILKKEKPDIIHINGLDSGIGAQVALKLDIPFVWHIRQLLAEDLGMRVRNEKHIYKLLQKADSVIAISDTVKSKFETLLNKDLKLIPNGIPLENYKIEENVRFSNQVVNLLLAGRIIRQKGQFDAVKAIDYLVKTGVKNIHLTIAGNSEDIEYVEKIKKYIYNQGLHDYIEIIEHVDNLKKIREKCDIGLVCSKKEAFGRVTIETMVSRMLVIGANTGGTIEIIEDNVTGLLYQEGDYLSLARKIKFAIENKQDMASIIEKGYETALENYSISSVVNQIVELYHTIQNGKL